VTGDHDHAGSGGISVQIVVGSVPGQLPSLLHQPGNDLSPAGFDCWHSSILSMRLYWRMFTCSAKQEGGRHQ
jgi:hypothetical protein